MSTILKALKKLEDQKLQTQTEAGRSRYGGTGGPQPGTGGERRFLALALTVAILLASTATWLVARRSLRPPVKTSAAPHAAVAAKASQADVPAPPSPESQPKAAAMPVKAPQPLPSRSAVPIVGAPAEIAPATAPKAGPAIAAPPPKEPSTVNTATVPPVTEATPTAREVTKSNPTQPAAISPRVPGPTAMTLEPQPQEEAVPVLPRLDSSILKLQAVTWSDIPAKRFAVLNNKIVRTGESVAGYRIVAIGEDYVVVEQAGRRWEARFRPR